MCNFKCQFLIFCVFFNLSFLGSTSLAGDVEPVSLNIVDKSVELYGLIEAVQQATVSAQTSGRVLKINFGIGDYVKKGDVIVVLRGRTQESQLSEAEANYKRAAKEYNRVRQIYTRRLVSKSQLDRAESSFKVAKAALKRAQETVERTTVKAPYSGIVVKRHIEVGETAKIGQPLITGLSLEHLRVRIEVPENHIAQIKLHNTAYIQTNSQKIKLTEFKFSPFADTVAHTFTVKAKLPKKLKNLYPGSTIKLNFVIGKTKKLLIPKSAVIHHSEITAVYVKNKDKTVQLRQVRIGRAQTGNRVEVLSGLSEGEWIYPDPMHASTIRKQQNK